MIVKGLRNLTIRWRSFICAFLGMGLFLPSPINPVNSVSAQEVAVLEEETPDWVTYIDLPIHPSSARRSGLGDPLHWVDENHLVMVGYHGEGETAEDVFSDYNIWIYNLQTGSLEHVEIEYDRFLLVEVACAKDGEIRIRGTLPNLEKVNFFGVPGNIHEVPDFFEKPVWFNEYSGFGRTDAINCHPAWRAGHPLFNGWKALRENDGLLVETARVVEVNLPQSPNLDAALESGDEWLWYDNNTGEYFPTRVGQFWGSMRKIYYPYFRPGYFITNSGTTQSTGYPDDLLCVYHHWFIPPDDIQRICQPTTGKYSGGVSEALISRKGLILIGRRPNFIGADLILDDQTVIPITTGFVGNGSAVSPDGCRFAVNYGPTMKAKYNTLPRQYWGRVRIYDLCENF